MNILHSPSLPLRRLLLGGFLTLAGLTPAAAQQPVTESERLWLPASAANLRPFLVMAVNNGAGRPGLVWRCCTPV